MWIFFAKKPYTIFLAYIKTVNNKHYKKIRGIPNTNAHILHQGPIQLVLDYYPWRSMV